MTRSACSETWQPPSVGVREGDFSGPTLKVRRAPRGKHPARRWRTTKASSSSGVNDYWSAVTRGVLILICVRVSSGAEWNPSTIGMWSCLPRSHDGELCPGLSAATSVRASSPRTSASNSSRGQWINKVETHQGPPLGTLSLTRLPPRRQPVFTSETSGTSLKEVKWASNDKEPEDEFTSSGEDLEYCDSRRGNRNLTQRFLQYFQDGISRGGVGIQPRRVEVAAQRPFKWNVPSHSCRSRRGWCWCCIIY